MNGASLLDLSLTLNTHWVWFVDVMLGSIIALKLQGLENELQLQSESRGPLSARARHLFGAIAFFVFFAYHVGAYHMLIHKFPYKASLLSGGRHAIDLVMAFCLMSMLTNAVSRKGHERSFGILKALTLWHIFAIAWHFLANIEYLGKIPSAISYFPHIVFVLLYWATWFGSLRIVGRARPWQPTFFVILSVAVFMVAVYRYIQVFNSLI